MSRVGKPQSEEQNGHVPRTARADAKRNEEAVVAAARAVFLSTGVDAPVREIANRAGVGVGTVYRRFPNRAELIAEVFRKEIDACVAEAESISAKHPPDEALGLWLNRYADFMLTKRGLSSALHSGDPTYEALPHYFRERFEPVIGSLLEAAGASAAVGVEATPYDLLRAVGNLAVTDDDGVEHTHRMVELVVRGLKFRREGSSKK